MAKWNPRTARRNDPMAKIKDVEDDVKSLQTQNSTRQTTISKGALTVNKGADIEVIDGGSVNIEDGGSINVSGGGGMIIADGGALQTMMPGSVAGTITGSFTNDNGRLYGLLVQDDNYRTLFQALYHPHINSAYVGVGGLVASNERARVQNFAVDASNVRLSARGSEAGDVVINNQSGPIYLSSGSNSVHVTPWDSSTGSANCVIGSNGLIQRVSSSRRYKQDIEDFSSEYEAVMSMRPRRWRGKEDVANDPDTTATGIGFIAEELDELGLVDLVVYDKEGPESVKYDRVPVVLVGVVQRHRDQIEELQGIVEEQQSQIAALAARLDELESQNGMETS